MTRDDLFNINASIVKSLITAVGKYAPDAMVSSLFRPRQYTLPSRSVARYQS